MRVSVRLCQESGCACRSSDRPGCPGTCASVPVIHPGRIRLFIG